HNLKYWRLEPVHGFGVSAHSFDGRERYANARKTDEYVSRVEDGVSAEVLREPIDIVSERAFLGLRLEDGIDFDRESDPELERLRSAGLIVTSGGKLKLTRRGKLLSNEVFQAFV